MKAVPIRLTATNRRTRPSACHEQEGCKARPDPQSWAGTSHISMQMRLTSHHNLPLWDYSL